MHCAERLREFVRAEPGAVTVDWVVLTAAAVGLSIGAVGTLSVGTTGLGGAIQSSLSGASVALLGQGADADDEDPGLPDYEIRRLDEAGVATWTATFAAMTDVQLAGQVDLRLSQFESHLAAQNWTQALQRVDYYHLITLELNSRGQSLPAGAPTAAQLYQTYLTARG